MRVGMSSRLSELKTRDARRGKLRESEPVTVIKSPLLTDVMALIPGWPSGAEGAILVPGHEGLNEFLIQTGIVFFITGWIVLGWSTLAPKKESSIASR